MKKFVRSCLYGLEWFFYGHGRYPDPGYIMIPTFFLVGLCVVVSAPIWWPIKMLAQWSGYAPRNRW